MDHYKNFVKVVIALNVFFNYYYHKQFRFTVKKIEYCILLPFQSTNSILRFAVRRDLDWFVLSERCVASDISINDYAPF